jgi:lipopolysaccharide export system protein LptC
MRDRAALLAPLMLMILLAGITYWINQIVQADGQRKPLRHDPDYIITDFNVRRFDVNGILQHTLIADKMVHYPDDDTSVVTSPHLINHRQPVTEIFARQGLVGTQAKQIDFVDDVRVVRQGATGQALATVMETRLLTVFPDDEIGHTLTPVTITQGKSIITGNRLELNNKSGIAVLIGRVTGTLYRNQTPSP